MDDINTILEQLKKAGVSPTVHVHVRMDKLDAESLKTLQESLKGAGLTPQVHLDLHVSSGAATPGTEPVPPDVLQKSILVMVDEDKLNCMTFTKRDQAGKPIMDFPQPRVQLRRGDRLRVSTAHKVSDKDAGDGIILATGGIRFYFIVDCPANPDAVGLYIKQSDVAPG
jgi:hypothetical protein